MGSFDGSEGGGGRECWREGQAWLGLLGMTWPGLSIVRPREVDPARFASSSASGPLRGSICHSSSLNVDTPQDDAGQEGPIGARIAC